MASTFFSVSVESNTNKNQVIELMFKNTHYYNVLIFNSIHKVVKKTIKLHKAYKKFNRLTGFLLE